ncbi:MAG: hypothetical protein Q4B95_04605 [Lonepinella koalarum]|nr:hypothetical protein [Lonepinella koalarum]
MNKLLKIGAPVLFAFFLSACDKPDPAADFKRLMEFSEKQQQSQIAFQAELQQKLASQDPKQIEVALNDFSEKVKATAKDLEAVEVKSDEVKAFKVKMTEALNLSNELLADSVKMMQNPTIEAQQALQQKSQQALKTAEELQKQQAELQQKYTPAK